jgi:hypothetical protein
MSCALLAESEPTSTWSFDERICIDIGGGPAFVRSPTPTFAYDAYFSACILRFLCFDFCYAKDGIKAVRVGHVVALVTENATAGWVNGYQSASQARRQY